MNDATVGRNPAAGTAAKAIYALQYAEERGIAEISNQQDIALKRLALSLDDICRHEFTENRKIRIVGEDRSFLIEREIQIEHLQAEVDYYFLPGSMMSRTKEAVKNEVLQLLGEKLIEPWQARKMLASAVPEAFRQSYDLQEANARRKLQKITARSGEQLKPEPWENPDVCISVLEEFMLTQKFEVVGDDERKAIMQLWQAYQVQKRTNAAAAAGQPTPTQPTAVTAPAAAPAPGPGDNNAAATGAAQLEQQATTAEQPAEAQVNPGVATQ